jgi:hypothetical protein
VQNKHCSSGVQRRWTWYCGVWYLEPDSYIDSSSIQQACFEETLGSTTRESVIRLWPLWLGLFLYFHLSCVSCTKTESRTTEKLRSWRLSHHNSVNGVKFFYPGLFSVVNVNVQLV